MNNNIKILIIFYSFEGNTKLIAKTIAKEIGADILELKPKKDIKSKGLTKYFWGGKQVFFNEKPELEKHDINPEDYEIIFIGTPVWSLSYTPAIRAFLENHRLKNKKIALFCTHEGWTGSVFNSIKEKLKENNFVGEEDFINVLKNKKETIPKAVKWAKEIVKGNMDVSNDNI